MNNTNEKTFLCGCQKSTLDPRDYKIIPKESFPDEFQLRMTSIKDQGAISSCTGHGVATTAEHHNLVQNDIDLPLSPGFVYGCRDNGDYMGEGLSIRRGLKTLKEIGIPYQVDFPYNKEVPEIIDLVIDRMTNENSEAFKENIYVNRCSTYYRANSVDAIKTALMNHGPVVICVPWYDNITIRNGIMDTNMKGSYGYHCIVIYGWNSEGWMIQNSWGPNWGDSGRAILPYTLNKMIVEAWGVSDEITDDIDVPDKDTTWMKIKKFFYDIFNKISAWWESFLSHFTK